MRTYRIEGRGSFGDRILSQVRDEAASTINDAAEWVKRRSSEDAPLGPPLRIAAGEPGAGRFRAAVEGENPPGTLRRSGRLEYRATQHLTYAVVSFGGTGTGAEEYAAWQHEKIGAKHPRGGKAKYLEDNLKAMTVLLATLIAQRQAMRFGG